MRTCGLLWALALGASPRPERSREESAIANAARNSNTNPASRIRRGASAAIQNASAAGDLALFTALSRTGLYLEALQRECLGVHGLSFTEFSVLRLLQRAPGRHLTPTALAEAIVCTSGAMTKLIDRLQRAQLVKREPDPQDRRAIRVHLQSKGDRLATKAAATYRAGRERILEGLNAKETANIQRGVLRLLEVLEADRSER